MKENAIGTVLASIASLNGNRVGTDAAHNGVLRFNGALGVMPGDLKLAAANVVSVVENTDANGTTLKLHIPGLWQLRCFARTQGANAIQGMFQLDGAAFTSATVDNLPSGNVLTGPIQRGGNYASGGLGLEVPCVLGCVMPVSYERAKDPNQGHLRVLFADTLGSPIDNTMIDAGVVLYMERISNLAEF